MPDKTEGHPATPRVFVQTAETALPDLEDWSQVTEQEVALVTDMTRRNEISGGTPVVRAFEERWRTWIGTDYALTVVNGTSSLYSAYFGIGIGPDDEVICPVNTWICTVAPVPLLGATPVFCDIDPDSLQLDPLALEAKITEKTACIVAVHLWGNVCNLDAVMAVAAKHNIPVIEDCSHAHGAQYRGRMCGGIGEVGCWSLQGSKAVSAGEGGVMATSNTDVFERACLVGQVNRIKGMDLVTPHYAEHQPLGLGMKFRAHPLGIGVASVQLDKLTDLNEKRGAYVRAVEAGLVDIPGLRPLTVYEGAERGGFYAFPIIHDAEAMGISTEDFLQRTLGAGLKTVQTPYPNLHDLPLFAKGFDLFTRTRGPLCPENGWKGFRPGDFPNAERAHARTVFLPVLSNPIPEAADIVLGTLRAAAESR
jgi:dTDP-4-amino-4,6-dideoxygalactose transaminase